MNQKGGLLHYLHEDIIQNFTSPTDGFDVDCCPCVFSLLGIEEDLFKILQQFSYRQKGMTNNDVISDLRTYFEEYKGNNLDNINIDIIHVTTNKELRKIFKSLPNNYGIFTAYTRQDTTGHCVLFANLDNTLAILDPQNGGSVFGFENISKYIKTQSIIELYFFVFKYKNGDFVRSFQRTSHGKAIKGIFLENYVNLDIDIPDLEHNDVLSFSIPKNSNVTVDEMNKFWETIDYTDFLKINKERGCSINVLTYLGIIRTYAEGDVFVSLLNNNITKHEVIFPGAAETYGGLLDHPGALNFSEILAIIQNVYKNRLIDWDNNTFFKLKERKYNFLEDAKMESFLYSNDVIISDSEMFYNRFISLLNIFQQTAIPNHFYIVKFNRKCTSELENVCYYGHTQIIYKQGEQLYIIDPQVIKIYDTTEKLKSEEGKRQLSKLYREQGYIGASFISGNWEKYDESIQEFIETPFIKEAEDTLKENNIESWIGDESTIKYVKKQMKERFPDSLGYISLSQLKWKLFDLYKKQNYKDIQNVIQKTVNNVIISKDEWKNFFDYLYINGVRDLELFNEKWTDSLPNREVLDYLLSKNKNYDLSNINYSDGNSMDTAPDINSMDTAPDINSMDTAPDGNSMDTASDGNSSNSSMDIASDGNSSMDIASDGNSSMDTVPDGNSMDTAPDGNSMDTASDGGYSGGSKMGGMKKKNKSKKMKKMKKNKKTRKCKTSKKTKKTRKSKKVRKAKNTHTKLTK